ncbi:MAG: hypothetical protein E7319_05000 [Clostridiales bacterium]|nr:hypothetical protein [Clostridiales bacterium]
MFNNAGHKVKTYAKVVSILMMILFVFAGLVLMFSGQGTGVAIGGIFYIAIGCLVAWLSGLVLFAMGQACESAQACEAKLQELTKKLQELENK